MLFLRSTRIELLPHTVNHQSPQCAAPHTAPDSHKERGCAAPAFALEWAIAMPLDLCLRPKRKHEKPASV
jgi:hypothetical protein